LDVSDFLANPDETKEFSSHYRVVYSVVAAVMLIFAMRLWYLQVILGSELRAFSEQNRIKENYIPAPRGMIFDREGRVLVDNRPGFVATLTPQYISDYEKTAKVVGHILGLDPKWIVTKVKQSRKKNGHFFPVRIKENLTLDEVARLEGLKLDHPGLDIEMAITRSYHMKQSGAQLFGYVGEISEEELNRVNRNRPPDQKFRQGELIGKSGLEQVYDTQVRGKKGLEFVQVDARGRVAESRDVDLLQGMPHYIDAEPGDNLILNIDQDIQEAAYRAFTQQNDRIGPRIGALVALNPNNGEVLAWVSSPSYDPNEFSKGISPKMWSELVNDPFQILRNKVIQTHQPPGSTFKAIVALAGLQEKVITPTSTFFCKGFLKFGRRNYHCHLRYGHGDVNVVQALEESCDVFFYRTGIALGIDKIAKYASALGIGHKTLVNLIGEVPGLMPTTEWKLRAIGEEWQPGENLSNAIGQGFVLATPLQMAVAFGAIGTDGKIFRPIVVRKVVDTNDHVVKDYQPELVRDLSQPQEDGAHIDRENFEIVKKGLWSVANGEHGTAKWWKIPGVEFAGKTGTVQLFTLKEDQVYSKCENRPLRQRHHGWFVGYAPADKPEIVVSILAEHACHGNMAGAPVARDVMRAYFQKYHPDMIKNDKLRMRVLGVPKPEDD
jgi:penicillin-binding protein 2